jgi:uncharacterized protein (TIGR02246 family)
MARSKSPPPSSPDDVEAEFYKALQRADLEGLMALWSDDDEITCIGPDGSRQVGAPAIRAAFEAVFARGPVDARPEIVRRLQSHACSVHSVLSRVRAKSTGVLRTDWIVATNVYLKTAQGWRLVAHHASPASDAAVQDVVDSGSVLH